MTELFELPRLAALAHQALDEQTALECRRLATAAVYRAVGYDLTAGTHDWTGSATYADEVMLPRGPVTAITSVKVVDDDGVEYPLSAGQWQIIGRRLRVSGRTTNIGWPYRVRVAYTHGSDDPEWLESARSVALQAALRLYLNPESLRSESVGSYTRTSSVETLEGVLTPAEKRELRTEYGWGNAYSVGVGR